jgi:hypothetical protein
MHVHSLPPQQDPQSVPAWGAALRPAGPFDPWQSFNAACDVWSGGHADAAGLLRRVASGPGRVKVAGTRRGSARARRLPEQGPEAAPASCRGAGGRHRARCSHR